MLLFSINMKNKSIGKRERCLYDYLNKLFFLEIRKKGRDKARNCSSYCTPLCKDSEVSGSENSEAPDKPATFIT